MATAPTHPANRLARETSPYLLQHAHNPVDWYPWGPEALERARTEDKPIFLSIGYSACHWCHVMERESFENEAVARLMNEHFVNIKVDREERPDLDEIYMKAVQSLTGQGGWPMSVFLTPGLEPFYGGTYFPPHGAYGRPGFTDLLMGLARTWKEDRERVLQQGSRLRERIAAEGGLDSRGELEPGVLDHSLTALQQSFDPLWGGFGDAPKFPHSMDLRLCLRHASRTGERLALDLALVSLDRMASGGLHDQLGGGFHRYSTDREWLVPHFEKMLYDNALLVPAYLEAFQVTREPRFAAVARAACDWMLREMTTPEGGFASSQDADSEGEEGRFFSWTPAQFRSVLGTKLGEHAAAWFGVTEQGNFEGGASVLSRHEPLERVAAALHVEPQALESSMREVRARLFDARSTRIAPATDDKVLVAWNGLAISALALAAQVLGEQRYAAAARRAADSIWNGMRDGAGRLFATARAGRAHIDAGLDDHAFLLQGLLDLYETDFDPSWLERAALLAREIDARFADREHGGYFTTAAGQADLIARLKGPQDGALPSGNGVHALNLLRLAELTGDAGCANRAQETILAQAELLNRYPSAFSQMLIAVDFLQRGPLEIVLTGNAGDPAREELLRELRTHFLPSRVVAATDPRARGERIPLLRDRPVPASGALAYVCRNYACQAPVSDSVKLREELLGVSPR
ncbi:MAG: thioredoxin domain-containing protein [Planctomycetes bacterium]|nr:thioredoxin domain-containing protein [Planctomycetota bacterium]